MDWLDRSNEHKKTHHPFEPYMDAYWDDQIRSSSPQRIEMMAINSYRIVISLMENYIPSAHYHLLRL